MEHDKEIRLMRFIDTCVDALVDSIGTPFKSLINGRKVVQAGVQLLREEDSAFVKLKTELKKALKSLARSNRVDSNQLELVLEATKQHLDSNYSLLDIYNAPDGFINCLFNTTSIPRESRLPNEYVRIICDHILKLVPPEEWSKATYDQLQKQRQLLLSMSDSQEELHHKFDELCSGTIVKTRTTPQPSSATVSLLKSDNLYYIEKYEFDPSREHSDPVNSKLFLDQDQYISLKSIFIDPLSEDNHPIFETILSWMGGDLLTSEGMFTESASKLMLLYGAAGVGKSSLVAKIIAENILGEKRGIALALRKHIDCISSEDPWHSIMSIIGASAEKELMNKVLILDGLDEVCVLKSGFDANHFISELSKSIPHGVRVIITSRDSDVYFNRIIGANGQISVHRLYWGKDQAYDWCRKYAKKRHVKTVDEWVECFISQFDLLDPNLREVFCVPIILYMACHESIPLSNYASQGEIYEKTFRSIAHREYCAIVFPKSTKEVDEMEFNILWELIKELSFQMMLENKIEEEIGGATIDAALDAVIAKTQGKKYDRETLRKYLKHLPSVFLFSSQKKQGIEFAHKSVAEFFSATKIYEDYLSKIDLSADYKKMWFYTFEAFRYTIIPEEVWMFIYSFLQRDHEESVIGALDVATFMEHYNSGMVIEEILLRLSQKPEYIKMLPLPNAQLSLVFSNISQLIHIFIELFDIQHTVNYDIQIYLHNGYRNNFNKWGMANTRLCNTVLEVSCFNSTNLENANLTKVCSVKTYFCNADLRGADLSYASFFESSIESACLIFATLLDVHMPGVNAKNADFTGSYIVGSNLAGAWLEGCSFKKADLSMSILTNAFLDGADFTDANLSGANLYGIHYNNETKWTNARYCLSKGQPTFFPDGFDPHEHGMLEVNEQDIPICL